MLTLTCISLSQDSTSIWKGCPRYGNNRMGILPYKGVKQELFMPQTARISLYSFTQRSNMFTKSIVFSPNFAFSELITFLVLSQQMLYPLNQLIFLSELSTSPMSIKMLLIAPAQLLCLSVLYHFRQHFNLLVFILCVQTFSMFSFRKQEVFYKLMKSPTAILEMVKETKGL